MDIDAMFAHYLDRLPEQAAAMRADPQHAAHLAILRGATAAMDRALKHEGVSDIVRQRVFWRVMLGAPEPEEGFRRVAAHERLVRLAQLQQPTREDVERIYTELGVEPPPETAGA